MSAITPEKVAAGQAVYTPATLKLYDTVVLSISNRLLWRCPTARLLALYERNLAARHLDVGVGTGYFLDKAHFPVAAPEITLLDLNPHCLDAAARRIARYTPDRVQADILKPLPHIGPFGSIALGYLLHCLPGAIADKAIVFDHLLPVLAADGTLFGATILQGDAPRSAAARAVMAAYNRKGVFSNTEDTRAGLEGTLRRRFAEVEIEEHGCVALFTARAPRPSSLA